VISLDRILCPSVFKDLTDEDWSHNVQEDFKLNFFYNLDYVLGKVAGQDQVNVLALMHNPTVEEFRSFSDQRFSFRGFDLVELETGISALVNCGEFPKAFSSSDLSDCGLLTEHAQALLGLAEESGQAKADRHRRHGCRDHHPGLPTKYGAGNRRNQCQQRLEDQRGREQAHRTDRRDGRKFSNAFGTGPTRCDCRHDCQQDTGTRHNENEHGHCLMGST